MDFFLLKDVIVDISKNEFFLKALKLGIDKAQVEALWDSLEKNDAIIKASNFSKLIYYIGAMIVIGAMIWLMQMSWVVFGAGTKFLVSSIYAVLFGYVGWKLWKREDLKIPAGLFVTLAVCMVPLAIYGLQSYLNIWHEQTPDLDLNILHIPAYTQLTMEIGTILAGIFALRFVSFPFLTAPIFLATWFLIMETIYILIGKNVSWEMGQWVSLGFGLVLLGIAYVMDLKKLRDYAFWAYFFGILAFWISLTSLSTDRGEFFQFSYFLVNILLMVIAVLLNRKIFMVFGAVGTFIYFNYLAYKVFQDSILFPFAMVLLGMAVIWIGIFYQKNNKNIERKIIEGIPDWLKKYFPARF